MYPSPPAALLVPRAPVLDTPLILALIGASGLHLLILLLLSVSFAWPEPHPLPESAMEVVVLKDLDQGMPNRAPDAALSQREQQGESAQGKATIPVFGESSLEGDEPATPEPSREETRARSQQQAAGAPAASAGHSGRPDALVVPLTPPQAAPVLHSAAGEVQTPRVEPSPPRQAAVDAARILASQGLEVARLGDDSSSSARRQRRRAVSASTREFRYASYLDAWAKKVERIGNLNYPQAAREQGLYGSLVLHVAVRKDGSVESIRVVRSSGIELLDQAAIQIVELAAPFSPFPPEIAAETDVLDIIRTWQFMRGDVLGWGR